MRVLFGLIFLTIMLFSCASHQGYMSTNAVIIDTEFQIVGTAVGQSKSWKLLGVGGVNRDALVFDAKKDLYSSIELKPGQALTNITVDMKKAYYLLFWMEKVTVTAEIVDFNPGKELNWQNYYSFQQRKGLSIGDPIYIKHKGEYHLRKIDKLDLDDILVVPDSTLILERDLRYPYSEVFHLKGKALYADKIIEYGQVIYLDPSGNMLSKEEADEDWAYKVLGISNRKALLWNKKEEKHKTIQALRIKSN
jgi:hypothetical protein